jgi:hypothetical protein
MKKLLFILVLTSCSSNIVVRTDFDKTSQILTYTTYDWLRKDQIESRNSPLTYNELNDERIKTAVNAGLAEKGYVLDTNRPQFLIHYHITIEEKSQLIETEPYGYSYGQFWRNTRTEVRRYQEGTLILDVMDADNRHLIWRSWAVSVLDDRKLVSEELINEAVKEILERFPSTSDPELKYY